MFLALRHYLPKGSMGRRYKQGEPEDLPICNMFAFRIKARIERANARQSPILLFLSRKFFVNRNSLKMNKKLPLFLMAIFGSFFAKAQFDFNYLQYFVGSGSDTAMLVVDFKDGSPYATDSSYAWGFLFNDSTTGEDILNAIAAADVNFSVNISGGFLNDVIYNNHSGLGGQPDYWSTWSGTDLTSLTMNAGIGTTVYPNDLFAMSYTDFNPAATPGEPIAAYDPELVTFNDVDLWLGSGQDSAVLVVDFLSLAGFPSHSVGFLFNDSISGEDMLNAFAAYDTTFIVNMAGGFLNDITYAGHSGIGGSPNYWGTWSATNWGNWYMNAGISTQVKNGDFFGCTYTDFNPALRPTQPAAVQPIGLEEVNGINVVIYPNPTSDYINIEAPNNAGFNISIFSLNGQKVLTGHLEKGERFNVSNLAKGTYLIQAGNSVEKLVIL